jgi:transaldolase
MPLATIDASAAHGIVAGDTAKQNVDPAHWAIKRLDAIGIDMEAVTAKPLVDGLRVFAESYEGAVQIIASKADAVRRGESQLSRIDD